jgi:hypothetical protein
MTIQEKYQAFIKKIKWGKKTNVDATKLHLMKTYDPKELSEIEDFGRELAAKLETAVDAYESRYGELEVGSDDGFYDLRCHVASMGEAAVERAIKNPKLLQTRHRRHNYRENFFYIFPFDDDHKMLTLDYYTKACDRIRKYIGEPEDIDQNEVLDVLSEIEKGIFSDQHSYESLTQLSNDSDIMGEMGYSLPNIWKDGTRFYGK